MVLVDGAPAGQAHFEIDTPKLLEPSPHTAWFGLMIGETRLRGLGLGRRIVGHLEELAQDAGATQVEIGVFAYNERSLRFFENLGYGEFARIPERAWWAGQLWEDIRLSKSL
jgi:RimJ/RimL family protein N-acetyltransferase